MYRDRIKSQGTKQLWQDGIVSFNCQFDTTLKNSLNKGLSTLGGLEGMSGGHCLKSVEAS